MSTTCGYLCPVCEGRGFKEDGSECDWCTLKPVLSKEQQKREQEEKLQKEKEQKEKELEEWIAKVHQGPCCSDPGEECG